MVHNNFSCKEFGFLYHPRVCDGKAIGFSAQLISFNEKITIEQFIASFDTHLEFDSYVLSEIGKELTYYRIECLVSIKVHASSFLDDNFLESASRFRNVEFEVDISNDRESLVNLIPRFKQAKNISVVMLFSGFDAEFSTNDDIISLQPKKVVFDYSLIKDIDTSYSKFKYVSYLYSMFTSTFTDQVIFRGVFSELHKLLIGLFCKSPVIQEPSFIHPSEVLEYISHQGHSNSIYNNTIKQKDSFDYDLYKFVVENRAKNNINEYIKNRDRLGLIYNKITEVSLSNFRDIYYSTDKNLYGGALSLIENADKFIVMRNDNGVVVFDNREHQRLTGGSIVGKPAQSVIDLNENYRICIDKDRRLLSLDKVNFIRDIEMFDGLEYETIREKLIYNNRKFIITTIQPLDVTSSSLSKDELTGCFNRSYLKTNLISFTNKTVAFLDLDGFKKINDVLGHTKGDECLKSFVSIVTSFLRNEDILIRYGGDEFIIIFNLVSIETITSRLVEINNKVSDYFNIQGIKLSFSFGISKIQKNELEEAIKFADKKMYIEKFKKKNLYLHG